MPRTFTTETPLEALVVEQALLLARQVQQAADAAADGKVLSAVEGAAVPAARELARRAVEAALQQQAAPAEKSDCDLRQAEIATESTASARHG